MSYIFGFIILLSLAFVLLFVVVLIWGYFAAGKQEKRILKYLDKCDEKLNKGEMTKEENDQIHFYYMCEFPW